MNIDGAAIDDDGTRVIGSDARAWAEPAGDTQRARTFDGQRVASTHFDAKRDF